MKKHYFNPRVAEDVGLQAAVVFELISFWISRNRASGKNFKEGRTWTFITQADIAEQFCYLSTKQVRTALSKLIDAGYITSGEHNRNKWDRTRWYSLADKGELMAQESRVESPKKALRGVPAGGSKEVIKQRYRKEFIDKAKINKINEALRFNPYA